MSNPDIHAVSEGSIRGVGAGHQDTQLKALLLEKKQLVQRLESLLREVEQGARIDQAIAKTTNLLSTDAPLAP